MKVTILGSGGSLGVPIPTCHCPVCSSSNPKDKRSRTSALLTLDDGRNILFDSSIDLRHHALLHGVNRIDAVVFTHAHADHILGLDDLRSFCFSRKTSIPCYATTETIRHITHVFSYIFQPKGDYLGGKLPELTLHEIRPYEPFEVLGLNFHPFLLEHGKMDVLGFRIKSFVYATDCGGIPEKSIQFMEDSDHLVLSALRNESHPTHLSIPEAVTWAERLRAGETYLIHLGHTVDHEAVNSVLPKHVQLSYDGLVIDL